MKNKIRLLSFTFTLIFVMSLWYAILSIGLDAAFANSNEKYSASVQYDESIADCIEKDSVIVTLTENETRKFKTYSAYDFKEIGCVDVEDLTQFTDNHVNKIVRGIPTDQSMLVEIDNYKRILKLNLNKADTDNIINAINVLNKRKDVLTAGPNYIYTCNSTPDDEFWENSGMWGLKGANGIKAESAWEITTGVSTVTVGILDSGIQANHPDLINRISTAGLHRDCLVNPIATVSNTALVDPNGHGTHVAGIIGAQGNNSVGICGVCWDVRLVSLRVFDENGKGNTAYVTRAINYAASKNIPILNYSGGGFTVDENEQNALENYKGLFVCSAGNGGDDYIGDNNDEIPHYPSDYSYNQSYSNRVISVGSINSNGYRLVSSNYGKKSVSIFAPGGEVYSTVPNSYDSSGYYKMSGTSMAAPHVTGVAALMLSYNPNLTAAQLKAFILDSADKDSSLSAYCVSGGRLNAYKALLKVAELTAEWTIKSVINVGDYQRFYDAVTVTYGSSTQYTAPDLDGQSFVSWKLRGTHYDTLATGTNKTINISYSTLFSAYPKGGTIYLDLYYEEASCVAAGTLITLADGSRKAVEELTGNEMLLVWNLETGTYDYAPILVIDSDPLSQYKIVNLSFSDGTTVDVISEHGFWDVDLNKYVYLDEYASEYIGHSFLKQSENGMTEVTLMNVVITTEVTTAYSPVTYGHLCYYVNGMLSMPGGIDGLFNIFEVDSETMMYDAEAMAADIEEYGLFTYEEFNALVPVSEELFEAVNGKYLKVATGKGIINIEQIRGLINRYSELFV